MEEEEEAPAEDEVGALDVMRKERTGFRSDSARIPLGFLGEVTKAKCGGAQLS